MKAKSLLLNVSLAFFMIASNAANASLIVNGSFEDMTFGDGNNEQGQVKGLSLTDFDNKRKAWDVYAQLPGWMTVAGSGMELQKNVVSKSQHGSHHLELDSHPRNGSNSVIAQQVDNLILGDKYLLEFFYKPRTNRRNDNGIDAFWFDGSMNYDTSMDAVFSIDLIKSQTSTWQRQTVLLTAQSNSMTLGFGAFGSQNTLGGLIDNVSLTHFGSSNGLTTAVSEPATLAMFIGGLLLAVSSRRKKIN